MIERRPKRFRRIYVLLVSNSAPHGKVIERRRDRVIRCRNIHQYVNTPTDPLTPWSERQRTFQINTLQASSPPAPCLWPFWGWGVWYTLRDGKIIQQKQLSINNKKNARFFCFNVWLRWIRACRFLLHSNYMIDQYSQGHNSVLNTSAISLSTVEKLVSSAVGRLKAFMSAAEWLNEKCFSYTAPTVPDDMANSCVIRNHETSDYCPTTPYGNPHAVPFGIWGHS